MMNRKLIFEILFLTIAIEQSIAINSVSDTQQHKSDLTSLSYISGLTGLTCITSSHDLSSHYHQMEAGTWDISKLFYSCDQCLMMPFIHGILAGPLP